MPISINEFRSGELPSGPTIPEQVVTYLSANSDQAFTRAEIATALNVDANAVSTALSRLESRDLVSHKGKYWAITEDEERIRAAYDIHAASVALDLNDGGIDVDAWDDVAPDEPHPSERATDADSEDFA
jgi:predicted transcriptional regulator